ncbi:DNA-binding protein [Gilvimarinus algae]|uniref:DNA-binding protein n=1 Tax=Gilvimarinus algae TaxID=3058037 RepID=A0ABT8TE74_9GAMM|nr:DNA-binding protein [Gilvimarinus sp. SDUM040014]MDO3382411.1 DNA-binding protein [Gilvimarinus sp. SDUM040014]
MARGGINKALVAKAHQAVLARGENPSIDAIRIELGNTGSKSTIHRYLKELEEEASTRMDDEALLSQPIRELIARLASRLQEEAHGIVDESKSHYEHQLNELSERYAALTQEAGQMVDQHNVLERRLDETCSELSAKSAACDALDKQLNAATQREASTTALLKEKQAHIESLEEKHRHGREALEHYRESVKEQRDQDQCRHEHQIQQLQAEIRTLNQAISVKQGDLTQLNKDNARLVSELNAARKVTQDLESKLTRADTKLEDANKQLQTQSADLQQYADSAQRQASQIDELTQRLESAQSKVQDFTVSQAKLEAELSVKNDMIERLMAENRRQYDEPAT